MTEEGLECPFCLPWSETVTRQKRSPKRPGTSGSDGDGFRRGPRLTGEEDSGWEPDRKEEIVAQNKIRRTCMPHT